MTHASVKNIQLVSEDDPVRFFLELMPAPISFPTIDAAGDTFPPTLDILFNAGTGGAAVW